MNMRRIQTFFTWVMLSFASLPSQALIGPPTASAANQTVTLTNGANVNVTWTINFTAAVGPAVISSTQVVFRTLAGDRLASVPRSISKSLSVGGSYQIEDSIFIPPNVANAAFRLGSAGIRIERTFADSTGGTGTGTFDFYLGTAPSTGLMVSRVDLRLSNQSRASIVPRDSLLKAIAQVQTDGNGWLDARWEIADGAGLQGEPLYRPLRAVREYVGGGQILNLESPKLPTTGSGRYLVRLSIREPQGTGEAAPLLYQVMDTGNLDTLALVSPADRTLLLPSTRFAWLPVTGAKAFVLELLPDQEVVGTGAEERRGAVMVPSDSTELQLSNLVRQGLISGQRYSWRVIALDVHGQTLSRSALRQIQLP
jgi:hypothetical protein